MSDLRSNAHWPAAGWPVNSRRRTPCRPSACSSTTAAARSSATTLGFSATVTVGECHPDGRRELRLRVTVHSAAPSRAWSKSVTGLAPAGDKYTARTFVSVHTPTGAVLTGRLDGRDTAMGSGTHGRRQVAVANVETRPGRPGRSTSRCSPARPAPGLPNWCTRPPSPHGPPK
ncbi:hypothetical protein V2I01_36035 [Micromonospora sp. BRA006-A]|nr:hypothetical protein [Micromonospora sp. BRA006-A]